MSQKAVEIILSRHLASWLATPIFLVDRHGVLLYYNEPAERILGQRFEETGEVPARVWSSLFQPRDAAGRPLPLESLPLPMTLATGQPAHGSLRIRGLDGIWRSIQVVAIPIIGQAARFLGGMAFFWEVGEDWPAAPRSEPGSVAAPGPPIEIILARQLASYLAMPIMIFDLQGNLVFYNEPAESILGQRFEESGEIQVVDLVRIFHPTDERGGPIPAEQSPTQIALFERRPAYHHFWIWSLDGVRRHIEVRALPLIGEAERFLGVIELLWEVSG